jgi:hypothetical protein
MVGTFTHWLAWGISLDDGLAEGDCAPGEGRNDVRAIGYRGPCPPRGLGPHRYFFCVEMPRVAPHANARSDTRVRVRNYRVQPTTPVGGPISDDRTIEPSDGLEFYAWGRDQWSAPYRSVDLDPWELSARLAEDRPDDTRALRPGRSRPPGEDPSAGGSFRARGGAAGTA